MNIHRRYKPPETLPHRFAIGQQVRLRSGGGAMMETTAIFEVLATLPPLGRLLQYRIRDAEEKYERVTTEDNLEAIDIWSSGETATVSKHRPMRDHAECRRAEQVNIGWSH